jgi:uncharacterized protein Yka (UPF0111/DUF47 family)
MEKSKRRMRFVEVTPATLDIALTIDEMVQAASELHNVIDKLSDMTKVLIAAVGIQASTVDQIHTAISEFEKGAKQLQSRVSSWKSGQKATPRARKRGGKRR